MSLDFSDLMDDLDHQLEHAPASLRRGIIFEWLARNFESAAVAFVLDREAHMKSQMDVRAELMELGRRDLARRMVELTEWNCERDGAGIGIDRYEARVVFMKPLLQRSAP